jgi:hypothetical protein
MGQLPMLRMLAATNGCRLSLFPRIAQIRALMRRECLRAHIRCAGTVRRVKKFILG